MSNLVALSVNFQSQASGNRIANFSIPRNGKLVGIDKGLTEKSGTMSVHTVDVNKGGSNVLAAVCAGGADDTRYGWRSSHYGGDEEMVDIEANVEYNLDFNISGGGNSSANVILWILLGEL